MPLSNHANSKCVYALFEQTGALKAHLKPDIELICMDGRTYYHSRKDGKCILNASMNDLICESKLICPLHNKIPPKISHCYEFVMSCNIVAFKGINDIFSLEAGDAFIRYFSNFLRETSFNKGIIKLRNVNTDMCEVARNHSDKFHVFYIPKRHCMGDSSINSGSLTLDNLEIFWNRIFDEFKKKALYIYMPEKGKAIVAEETEDSWDDDFTIRVKGLQITFGVSDTKQGAELKVARKNKETDKPFRGNVHNTLLLVPEDNHGISLSENLILKVDSLEAAKHLREKIKSNSRFGDDLTIRNIYCGTGRCRVIKQFSKGYIVFGHTATEARQFRDFSNGVRDFVRKIMAGFPGIYKVTTLDNKNFL